MFRATRSLDSLNITASQQTRQNKSPTPRCLFTLAAQTSVKASQHRQVRGKSITQNVFNKPVAVVSKKLKFSICFRRCRTTLKASTANRRERNPTLPTIPSCWPPPPLGPRLHKKLRGFYFESLGEEWGSLKLEPGRFGRRVASSERLNVNIQPESQRVLITFTYCIKYR